MAVAAAGDVQPRGVLGRVAAAVAPGELGGGLRVVLDQVLEDGDADLLDARGLDDLFWIFFFFFFFFERLVKQNSREGGKKKERNLSVSLSRPPPTHPPTSLFFSLA